MPLAFKTGLICDHSSAEWTIGLEDVVGDQGQSLSQDTEITVILSEAAGATEQTLEMLPVPPTG